MVERRGARVSWRAERVQLPTCAAARGRNCEGTESADKVVSRPPRRARAESPARDREKQARGRAARIRALPPGLASSVSLKLLYLSRLLLEQHKLQPLLNCLVIPREHIGLKSCIENFHQPQSHGKTPDSSSGPQFPRLEKEIVGW